MTLTIEKSILIQVPPERLWQVLADHSRMSQWAGMHSVTITSSEDEGLGLTCTCDFGMFKVQEQVIQWQENRRIVHQLTAMGMPMTESWVLEPTTEGTRFLWHQEIELTRWRKPFGPLFKWQFGRMFNKAMWRLKSLVENGA